MIINNSVLDNPGSRGHRLDSLFPDDFTRLVALCLLARDLVS